LRTAPARSSKTVKAAETKPAKKAEKPAEDTRSAMQKLADKFRG
jgi:PTH1 family peptidyl-tRNA hydrolase